MQLKNKAVSVACRQRLTDSDAKSLFAHGKDSKNASEVSAQKVTFAQRPVTQGQAKQRIEPCSASPLQDNALGR